MTADKAKGETVGQRWRYMGPALLGTLVYLIPLFWLWNRAGYPEAFGVHGVAHGEAGLIRTWWYSYRLLERHQVWDVMIFVSMWGAVAAILIAMVGAVVRDRGAGHGKGDAR